jgi:GntR family transcriptional regulator
LFHFSDCFSSFLDVSRAESASTASHPSGDADILADRRRLRSDRARQVADVLRRQVLQGSFTAGSLPAEASLAGEFGVSRNAVRDALDLLRDEGLVERVPGVGTTVAARKYPHGLEHLLGLAETLYEHGEISNEVRPGRNCPPTGSRRPTS